MANENNTVLYTGVTNNLPRRVYEHKNGLVEGFSNKYKLKYIIYFEEYKEVREAINREKQLKNWRRIWKINLIRTKNPSLKDLSENW